MVNRKLKKEFIPNSKRAVISGKIATFNNGRREVREYTSGEMLVGELEPLESHPTKKVRQNA